MVQVTWVSSPSMKGTALTLFTNLGGTVGPQGWEEKGRKGGREGDEKKRR